MVEVSQRLLPVGSAYRLATVLFKNVDQDLADFGVVLNDQDFVPAHLAGSATAD
jgi:hypothetical protein